MSLIERFEAIGEPVQNKAVEAIVLAACKLDNSQDFDHRRPMSHL